MIYCAITALYLYTCILKCMQQCLSLPVVLGGGRDPVPVAFGSEAMIYVQWVELSKCAFFSTSLFNTPS